VFETQNQTTITIIISYLHASHLFQLWLLHYWESIQRNFREACTTYILWELHMRPARTFAIAENVATAWLWLLYHFPYRISFKLQQN